jgi:coenzyme Q-binding protein COQ10
VPRHAETRHLPYRPEALFSIVANVEKYPEFLPWCVGARVRSRKQRAGRQIEEADLMVGFKGLTQTYTSEVTLDSGALTIDAIQLRGPFHHLINQWRFRPAEDGGTEIEFAIDFDFKNPVLRALINRLFGEAVQRMVSAFEARAAALSAG